MAIHIGFTGTSNNLSNEQQIAFVDFLLQHNKEEYYLHHGDCIGGDAFAHEIAHEDPNCTQIFLHPPKNTSKSAHCQSSKIVHAHTPKDYLVRNRDIVDDSNILFAMPRKMVEELRSGTWATVRYARKQKIPIIIFWPDGTIQPEYFD